MQVVMTTRNNVALYCRLSREDGDSMESSSIRSQKEILTEYAQKYNWNIFDTYVDDGFSGGNFNRPSFQRLITDVENGKVDIILTKDLSRLGRNYLQTGYYTEEYFPEHNIRYIAVNDNYDSTDDNNDFTPFKNIINQWYLKDISKKVKAVNDMRQRKGLLRKGGFPLFGYLHDEKMERVINEETASTVRIIFDLYLKNYTYKDIAHYLYENKLVTPEFYAFVAFNYNPKAWIDVPSDKKYTWSKGVINKILLEQQYIGDLILKKKQTISYKTHKRIKSKKDDLLVFENKFTPIITKEQFYLVKVKMRTKTKPKISLEENLYKDFVYCGNCGHALSLNRSKAYPEYRMKAYNNYKCRNKLPCDSRVNIRYEIVDETIKQEFKKMINVLIDHEKSIKEYAKTYFKKDNELLTTEQKRYDELIVRNKKLELLLQKLFEKNAIGDIPDDTYKKMNEGYKNELQKNTEEIKTIKYLNDIQQKRDYVYLTNGFYDSLYNVLDSTNIREILNAVIWKIMIYKNGKKYKFKFIYQNIPEMLEDYFKWKKQ